MIKTRLIDLFRQLMLGRLISMILFLDAVIKSWLSSHRNDWKLFCLETTCLIWLFSEALHLEGGYVTWNLNIKQIQSGALMPSLPDCCVGRRDALEGRGMSEDGKTSNFAAGRARGATRSNVLGWIIHDVILILILEKIAFSLCQKLDSETKHQKQS